MALRQAIRDTVAEMFEAIPERIEVAGHGPTRRVTGGSFEGVLDYVAEALDGAVVIGREDHHRWWPRVTLTVTTDPALVASAPPLETFADPEPESDPQPEPEPEPHPEPQPEPEPEPAPLPQPRAVHERPADREPAHREAPDREPAGGESTLEQMFAYQEDVRRQRLGIPRQREGDPGS